MLKVGRRFSTYNIWKATDFVSTFCGVIRVSYFPLVTRNRCMILEHDSLAAPELSEEI
jgi:hypothetical protein